MKEVVTQEIRVIPERMRMVLPKFHIWDTLPLHPQPEYGEALSSYLGRLMAVNKIDSQKDMLSLCFPEQHWRRAVDHLDYGSVSLRTLARLTACSVAALSTTTYASLVTRFGFDPKDNSSILFLRSEMTQTQQFCPQCIVDHPWYKLVWRFRSVRGCIHHNCQLLNMCKRCHAFFPLLYSFYEPGICLRCGFDHRRLAIESLSRRERIDVARYVYDLEYLLKPVDENESELNVTLHNAVIRLVVRQQAVGLTDVDIVPFLPDRIRGQDVFREQQFHLGVDSASSTFAYTYFLGLTISELFSPIDQTMVADVTQGTQGIGDIARQAIQQINNEETLTNQRRSWNQPTDSPMLRTINHVIHVVVAENRFPTVSRICEIAGISQEVLSSDPVWRRCLMLARSTFRSRCRYQFRRELVIKIVSAILMLREKKLPVSLTQIARHVDRMPYEILHFLEIAQILMVATHVRLPDEPLD